MEHSNHTEKKSLSSDVVYIYAFSTILVILINNNNNYYYYINNKKTFLPHLTRINSNKINLLIWL